MNNAMEGYDVAITDVVGANLNAVMDDVIIMRVIGR